MNPDKDMLEAKRRVQNILRVLPAKSDFISVAALCAAYAAVCNATGFTLQQAQDGLAEVWRTKQ